MRGGENGSKYRGKDGGKRERRQAEGEHRHESDDITLYNTMTLIKGAHTNTHRHVRRCAHLAIRLMKTSLHVCTAAGTNLSAVYMLKSVRELKTKRMAVFSL